MFGSFLKYHSGYMQGFEGMSKREGENAVDVEVVRASRAPLGLSGQNANLHTIRTFQSDLAETIKSGEGSLVKIAMAENERKERQRANVDPNSGTNKFYVLGGIALVIIAIGVIGFVLYQQIPKTVPVTQSPTGTPTVIKTDSVVGLNITDLGRDSVREQLSRQYLGTATTINTIQRILPFTQQVGATSQHVVTSQEFFTALGSVAPSQLIRSFDDIFTIGVYSFNGNGLFIAFKTNAYTTALAGMLEWEQHIFNELYSVFNITITEENKGLFQAQFKDRTIKNQDTRALIDAKGNVVLFYTFIGEFKDTLIIADKEQTLEEILNRLTANTLRH